MFFYGCLVTAAMMLIIFVISRIIMMRNAYIASPFLFSFSFSLSTYFISPLVSVVRLSPSRSITLGEFSRTNRHIIDSF